MDEGELDDWFVQERERIEEEFYTTVSTKGDREKARARFDKKYQHLITTIQKRQNHLYTHEQRMIALQKPIKRWKEYCRLAKEGTINWFARRKEGIRKWFFDQKIKRILRQR